MLWAKLLVAPTTSSGKRLSFVAPYRLLLSVGHEGGQMTSESRWTGDVMSDDRQALWFV